MKDNRCCACKACNNEKDDMDVEQYRAFLARREGSPIVFFGERSRLR